MPQSPTTAAPSHIWVFANAYHVFHVLAWYPRTNPKTTSSQSKSTPRQPKSTQVNPNVPIFSKDNSFHMHHLFILVAVGHMIQLGHILAKRANRCRCVCLKWVHASTTLGCVCCDILGEQIKLHINSEILRDLCLMRDRLPWVGVVSPRLCLHVLVLGGNPDW